MAFYLQHMKPVLNQVSIVLGIFMVVVVTSGAIAFAFTDILSEQLYGNKRTMFICVLAAYAIYRSFRVYNAIKTARNEE